LRRPRERSGDDGDEQPPELGQGLTLEVEAQVAAGEEVDDADRALGPVAQLLVGTAGEHATQAREQLGVAGPITAGAPLQDGIVPRRSAT
jgi:hypothetical protein